VIERRGARCGARRSWWCALASLVLVTNALAQSESGTDVPLAQIAGPFTFAVVASATADGDRAAPTLLRATDDSPARFVVHFEMAAPSPASCANAALDRRHDLLDASSKPIVPVIAASEWADCGKASNDALERLGRVGDTLFSGEESLGQSRMPWFRQSAVPRFHRYRENLRWQAGRVMFATINLPNNNNNFHIGAGRNGEFEERVVANRAWLERTFRIASERRLAGVVLFIDAAPRFSMPLRAPDTHVRERDGYYEWKVALRDFAAAFKGKVLLVQSRVVAPLSRSAEFDHPLRDVAGHTIENLTRVAAPEASTDLRWLRIDVDPKEPQLFRVSIERVFDDPSGELYGAPRVK
jgi:hypothetical protein